MAQRLKVLEEAHRETHWAAALVGPELLEFKCSADSVEMKQVLKCSERKHQDPSERPILASERTIRVVSIIQASDGVDQRETVGLQR